MTESFPPSGYVPAESAIEGIQIFKPAPIKEDETPAVIGFTCPQCGATTAYNVSDGGLRCAHCGYYEPPKGKIVGKRAEEFEFTLETMEIAAHGWGEARKELACQNCGAVTSLPVDTITNTCAFCGSNQVIFRDASQEMLRPRYLIPFKLETNECQHIARQWLASSWMTPAVLKQVAHIQAFTGVYLPFWTFDSTTAASWRGEVAHTKTERYYDPGSRSWKTRTRTVWRWESGQVGLVIDDLLVVGTNRLSQILLDRVKTYKLSDLADYDPKYLAGLQAQAYNVLLEDAWDTARDQMREQTRQACIAQATSSRIRNFSMSLDFRDETWRYILLPLYVAAYNYAGKTFQVMVNGQTGVISGQRPVDWNKIWLVIAALLAPGALLCLAGLITAIFGGVGILLGGIGFTLLIIGIVIAIVIFINAQKMDDA